MRRIGETHQRLCRRASGGGPLCCFHPPPPTDTPFKITWSYDPSTELGGDSFGYHWIDDEHFAIYLLDVSRPRCRRSVALRRQVRSTSSAPARFRIPTSATPSQVLASLNEAFQMERHNNMRFTIWYGVYNKNTRVPASRLGGHSSASPALVGGKMALMYSEEVRAPGMIIGVMPGVKYDSQEIAIAPGSRLSRLLRRSLRDQAPG